VAPGAYVGFTVRDTGTGSRPGLVLARTLAAEAGGFVSVDDAGKAGASVRVHLRAA
jgi:C4-dicarboxylate-specific signal transduction histidine kinase